MNIDYTVREEFLVIIKELESFYIKGVPEEKISTVSVSDMVKAVNDYLDKVEVEDDDELIAEVHKRIAPTLEKLSACVLMTEYNEVRLFSTSGYPDLKSMFSFVYALSFKKFSESLSQGDCSKFIKYVKAVSETDLGDVDDLMLQLLKLCVVILLYLDLSTLSVLARLLLKQAALESRCKE